MGDLDPMRRCSAHSKQSGEQCKQSPIPGGTVCHYHGGAAPQVKAAAQARILEMVDPALSALSRAIADDNEKTRGAAISAAKDILDRAGLAVATKIEVEGSDESKILGYLEGWAARKREEETKSKEEA